MGGMVMGECQHKQRMFCITQKNYKHFEGRYGKLPLGDVYTCHGFFQIMHEFEKPILKHLFISLLHDLSTKDFVTIGNLLSTKFLKPQQWLYTTTSRQTWVP